MGQRTISGGTFNYIVVEDGAVTIDRGNVVTFVEASGNSSTVTINGGTVNSAGTSGSGGTVTISGGTVNRVSAPAGTVNVNNEVGEVEVAGGTVNLNDGSSITDYLLYLGGTLNYTADSLTLDKTALTLTVNAEEQLTATIDPGFTVSADGNSLPVAWESSRDDVATVSGTTQSVTITALSLGTTTIKATAGNRTAECVVAVKRNSTLAIDTQNMDKDYDGTPVAEPSVTKNGSSNDVTFTWYESSDAGWTELESAPANAGNYKVVASVAEDADYAGASDELEFTISQTTNEWTEEPSIAGWKYGGTPSTPTATAKYGTVSYTYSDRQDGGFSTTVPTGVGPWYMKAAVEETESYTGLEEVISFQIQKGDSTIIFKDDVSLSKGYDGEAVEITADDVEKNGSANAVAFTWQEKNGNGWTDLLSAPVSVGSYRVVASVAEDNTYSGTSAALEFTISQTENEWTDELSISDWTYGGTASTPTAAAKYGTVSFTYSDSATGQFSDDVPTEAGPWYVKATVAGTDDYTSLEAVKEFHILQADSEITFVQGFSLDKGYDGVPVDISPDDVEKKGSANAVTFTWQEENGNDWTTLGSAPANAGSYRVVASVAEDRNHKSASAALEFTISQTTNEWTDELSISGWTYGGTASTPTAAAKYGTVSFTYSDSATGQFSDDVPTTAGPWYVKATVEETASYTGLEAVKEFHILQADSEITFVQGFSLDKGYDGAPVDISPDDVEKKGSANAVTFTWQEENGNDWTTLGSAPVNAGNYRVVASVAEDRNHKSASATLEFTISQTENEWTDELSISGWTYGGTPSTPTAAAKYGTVSFTYSDSATGQFSDDVPTEAGTWYVKATVAGTADYTGLEAVTDFEIRKALPTYEVPAGLTIKQGEALSTLALPDGFTWADETQTADTWGALTFKALFTPEDTDNYQSVEVDITVEVLPVMETLNQIPAISAGDKTLTAGDPFDPLNGVTATDAEDGDLTDRLSVTENHVDVARAGTYTVTYSVTDSQGATATKTITVTVTEKENPQGSGDTGTEKGGTDNSSRQEERPAGVKTGDSADVVVWAVLLAVSLVGAGLALWFRRGIQK